MVIVPLEVTLVVEGVVVFIRQCLEGLRFLRGLPVVRAPLFGSRAKPRQGCRHQGNHEGDEYQLRDVHVLRCTPPAPRRNLVIRFGAARRRVSMRHE